MNDPSQAVKPIARETLAEQMARDIMERIVAGSPSPGETLPAEPVLAEQYGVSRSVVRDATRLLAARGLVEIRHGKGVFVTDSQRKAFADALFLALRREGASVWDVEELEQILLPAALALAAKRASADELAEIRGLVEQFIEERRQAITTSTDAGSEAGEPKDGAMATACADPLRAIYEATHNSVIAHFSELIVALRSWREWTSLTPEEDLELDIRFLETMLRALETRDPQKVAEWAAEYQSVSAQPEIADAMKKTPIGDVPRIGLRP